MSNRILPVQNAHPALRREDVDTLHLVHNEGPFQRHFSCNASRLDWKEATRWRLQSFAVQGGIAWRVIWVPLLADRVEN